jgi:hypothetical protein
MTVLLARLRSTTGDAVWVTFGVLSSWTAWAGRDGVLAMGVQVISFGVTNADAGSSEENACVGKGEFVTLLAAAVCAWPSACQA